MDILRVTLILDKVSRDLLIKDLVEYVADILEKKYEILVSLRIEHSERIDFPILVIEDMEPIIIDKIPSINTLLNIFLAASDAKNLKYLQPGLLGEDFAINKMRLFER